MSKNFSYEKYLKLLEIEYIDNHEFISSMKKEEREVFVRTMKLSCQKFDISVLTYMRILKKDGYGCSICGISKNDISGKLCLDHNHDFEFDDSYNKAETIRGFLCTNCNFLLGYANDNTEILKKATYYLENSVFTNILYFPNRKHKLLKSDRQKIYLEQGGKCKICEIEEHKLEKELVTDHNHRTGEIRGLLCGRCNRLLGTCHDDVNILKNAILYLERDIDDEIYYNMDTTIMRGESPPVEFIKYGNLCFDEDWKKLFVEYKMEK